MIIRAAGARVHLILARGAARVEGLRRRVRIRHGAPAILHAVVWKSADG